MTASRLYRVRIHDGATALPTFTSPATAGGNALVVTSARGGVNPYIAEPPSGDGQSIDLITGRSEIGEYHILVIDETVSTATRVVTSVLADTNARWQLLSRRAVIEWSADGATWSTLVLGYLNSLRLAGALVWDLTIGETRRTEMSTLLFQDVAPAQTGGVLVSPTCLIGGPIRAGSPFNTRTIAFDQVEDFGPARFRVVQNLTHPKSLCLQLVGGWFPPLFSKLYDKLGDWEVEAINNYAKRFFVADDESWKLLVHTSTNIFGSFPTLAAELRPVYGGATVVRRPLANEEQTVSTTYGGRPSDYGPYGAYDLLVEKDSAGGQQLLVEWDPAAHGARPAAGTEFDVVVYVRQPSADYPVHERGHPVDLVTTKLTAAGVAYDAAAAAAARAAINTAYGGPVTCELTWDSTQKLASYAQEMLAFFGVGLRVSGAGELQMFGLRHWVPQSGVTITLAELRDADTDTFDLEEDSVVTTAEVRTREYLFTRSTTQLGEGTQIPADNLRPAWHTVRGSTDDTVDPANQRTHRWEIPGRVLVNGRPVNLEAQARAAGNWLVNWRRRGAAEFDLHCLPSVTAEVGDVVTVNLPHLPVAVMGAVPRTQRGQASIQARVLRRTETPAGPDLRLVYAPALDQAPLPALSPRPRDPLAPFPPTFELEASASEAARVALIKLLNALELLAAGLQVEFEYAFVAKGDPAPAGSGTPIGPYDPADAPASPVRYALPMAPQGSQVWVRGRSILPDAGRSSAWTEWTSFGLSKLPDGVRVAWTLSPVTIGGQPGAQLELQVSDSGGAIGRVQMRYKQRFSDAWPEGDAWSSSEESPSIIAPVDPMASPRLYRLTGVLADAYEGYFSYRLSGPGPTFEVLDERTIPVGSDSLRPTVLGLKVIRAGVRLTPAHPLVNVVRANITVDARTKSIKVYASKYGEPTAAHVIAYGTTYNVPDGTNSVSTGTLAAINLSAGETANVAVLPYTGQNGTGTVGTLARDTAFQDEGYPGGEVPPDVARTTQLANFTGGLQAGGVAVAVGQSVRTSDTVTFAAVSSPGVGSFNSGTFTAGITSRGRQVPTIQWGVGAPTSATPGVDGDIYVDVS